MRSTMPRVPFFKRHKQSLIFLSIALCALLIRLPYLGDPAPDNDEQLYHLIGLKMLSGSVPYVDLWDRKPFLLFVIYAIGAAIGHGSPLGYQLLSVCSAAVGAMQVYLMAKRLSDHFAALIASGLYLLSFPMFFAPLGASEVFYLPLVLGMFQLTLHAYDEDHIYFSHACLAMLLGGIALAIKYTALPEAIFFGCAILLRWRNLGLSWPRIAGWAGIFGLLGVAPTALIGIGYAALGHFDAFFYANFQSIFGRGSLSGPIAEGFKAVIVVRSFALALTALIGLILTILHKARRSYAYSLTIGYLCSGFAAFFMLGNLYVSYFMPVLPGLILASTPLFMPAIANRAWACVVFLVSLLQADLHGAMLKSKADRLAIAEIGRVLRPYVKQGSSCIYVYDGPTAIYQATGSCLPTRYIYPDHLNNAMEQNSIGSDPGLEIRRVIAMKPVAIVAASSPVVPKTNTITARAINNELRNHYKKVRDVYYPYRQLYLFVRNDLVEEPRDR